MTTAAVPQACDLLIEAGWVVPVVPHGVDGGSGASIKQTGDPEPQSMRPARHGLPESHAASGTHTVHVLSDAHASPTPASWWNRSWPVSCTLSPSSWMRSKLRSATSTTYNSAGSRLCATTTSSLAYFTATT